MKVSTRGRYGLRAMIDLSTQQDSGAIPLREISKRQKISEQYLEQIFVTLRKAGLVKSVRGAHGGYLLNKKAEDITVGDIIRALEGPVAAVDCVLDEDECGLISDCVTHELWVKVSNLINDFFDSTTLEDLKNKAISLEKIDNDYNQKEVVT